MLLAWCPGMNALSFSHEALDSVLQAHVRDALVDYGALARDRGPLDRSLDATQAARPDAWAPNEQMRPDSPIRFISYDWSLNGH